MPIVDVSPVVSEKGKLRADAARMLADSIARVFNAERGRVWVRVTELHESGYAENGTSLAKDGLPVFVQVLHADWPDQASRPTEARAIAEAVAVGLVRQVQLIHVIYAPAGRGRVALGSRLVE